MEVLCFLKTEKGLSFHELCKEWIHSGKMTEETGGIGISYMREKAGLFFKMAALLQRGGCIEHGQRVLIMVSSSKHPTSGTAKE